jgi:hypothetical protein
MKLCDTRKFRFDGIAYGPVGYARTRERHSNVNVIGDERLRFADLTGSVFGPHPYFRAPSAGIARGEDKFPCQGSDGGRSYRCAFLLAAGSAEQCGPKRKADK